MATRMLRRGLPRVAGGEPWPPAADIEVEDAGAVTPVTDAAASVAEPAAVVAEPAGSVAEPVEASEASSGTPNPSTGSGVGAAGSGVGSTDAANGAPLRRGLPRTPGGEPWPPAGAAASAAPAVVSHSVAEPFEAPSATPSPSTGSGVGSAGSGVGATESGVDASASVAASGTGEALRRGLPRVAVGEPWPPAGTAAVAAIVVAPSTGSGIGSADSGIDSAGSGVGGDLIEASEIPASAAVATLDVSTPLPFQRTVFPGENAFVHPQPAPEPKRYGPFTKGQWAGAVIVGGIALLGAAAMAVLFVRWFLSLDFMHDFLAAYPGEYHLPEGAPVGFPGWLGWQHFFNVFLMVLIIRSGLTIRHEKRPSAFWTPRGKPKGKVSLTIWFHQSLDILWLINGVVFIVLLFVTGQWMRVIPTSWEVFPNALSAVLQYVSLDWPTENGWVNYNSIQQIAYFLTIFIAAPLAAVTGFRMSGMWPKKAENLSKAYPIEWARAVHFPVMLYFVAFIAVHVFLVFATGALRNLNHMFAAQGSADPNAYADNWTGFWFFVASLVVIAAAWVAARPLVLAPIAKLFGTVSSR